MQTGKGICIPTAWINIMLTCFELTVSKSLKCFFFNLICICTLLSPVKLNMATSKRGKQYLPYLPLYIFATALILLHSLVAYLFWQPSTCQSAHQDSTTAHKRKKVALAWTWRLRSFGFWTSNLILNDN